MKKLTTREKVLLVVLIVVIITVGWYKLIYEPMNNNITKFNSDRDREQSELLKLLPKIEEKRQMQAEVEQIRASGTGEKIPTFDNSKPLMVALNRIMTAASSYSISFGDASRDDYIYLHKINLNFTADSYRQARQLIDRLTLETYVNQISDISMQNQTTTQRVVNDNGEEITKKYESVRVSLTITFFEIAG